jgi:membrane protein YqaA with SNARE-associated domain
LAISFRRENLTVNEPPSPSLLPNRASEAVGFLWGLAEATLFFIIPDVFFTLVALFSFRQSAKVLMAVLAGAVVGGSIMYAAGEAAPRRSEAAVLKVPFVSPSMLARTRSDLAKYGIWTMAKGPWIGLPYKLYAIQGSRYARWPLFLITTAVARMGRFVFLWLVAVLAGRLFHKPIANRPRVAIAIHAAIWIVNYIVYWSRI